MFSCNRLDAICVLLLNCKGSFLGIILGNGVSCGKLHHFIDFNPERCTIFCIRSILGNR